ncbi:MAG: peptidoglycan-binding protein [Candidatus Paceibacterota bacterium]|jgi:hypothetical protein
MRKYLSICFVLVFVLFGIAVSNTVRAVDTATTIVAWNFDDQNATADAGTAGNLTKIISISGATAGGYSGGDSGGLDKAISADHWRLVGPGDEKYWLTETFITTGYEMITVSSKQRSSSTGPHNFIMQYRVGDGAWSDLVAIAPAENEDWVFTNAQLPTDASDQTSVSVRWLSTDQTVSGTAGTNRLDDVIISGTELPPADTTAPILDITVPADGGYTKDNTISNLNFTASDDVDETLDYAVYVDDESALGEPVVTGTIPSGGGVGTSLLAQSDGVHTITVKVTDDAGNSVLESMTITVDTTDPTIISAISPIPNNTVEVLFSEELQNSPLNEFFDFKVRIGHHPDISDFRVYNDLDNSLSENEGDVLYEISSVGYSNKIVTITLTNGIQKEDHPRLYITPALASLVDLAENYFNGGDEYDMPIQVEKKTNTTSGGRYIPQGEPTKIPGCGTKTDGFSTINGKACANNIPHEEGQVLGADKFIFTLSLKREQPPYSTGAHANEVLELQKFLNANGYDSGPEDGKFGPLTEAAVIKFQLANGLVGDGVVGPLTRALLNK